MEVQPNTNINACCHSCASGGGCSGGVNGILEDILTGSATDKPLTTFEVTIAPKTLFMIVGGIVLAGLLIKKI